MAQRRPRSKHKNLVIANKSQEEIASEILGVQPEDYKRLNASERNLVASAKYRQKKVDQERELANMNRDLLDENEVIRTELATLQQEIYDLRTQNQSHSTCFD